MLESRSSVRDVAVIGGGILGLATACELLRRHPRLGVVVLEKEAALATHQSGHNSGVIHSGLTYKPGSLKARLCRDGRRALWAYCERKGIEYRNLGKLIVATHERELPVLDELYRRGIANGIEGLEVLDEAGICRREPHCRGLRALFSPSTGIVDFAAVARSYADDLRAAGGEIVTGCRVIAIDRTGGAMRLRTTQGEHEARHVVTCAGLHADRVARMTGGARDPRIVPFRGDFLTLKPERRDLVRGLIYPVPDPRFPFVGVHLTPRMNGEVWIGPNAVLAFAREGYRFTTIALGDLFETLTYPGFIRLAAKHPATGIGEIYRDLVRASFVKAAQRYLPELRIRDTLPGPSGVRAQAVSGDGSLVDDFVFEGGDGVLHVRNAPSPAATSSLAIAGAVADDAERRFDL